MPLIVSYILPHAKQLNASSWKLLGTSTSTIQSQTLPMAQQAQGLSALTKIVAFQSDRELRSKLI